MTTTPASPIVNRFGRKPGRGIRPWLLLPKVIAICIYVGGLASVLGMLIASGFASMDVSDARRELVLNVVSRLMVFLVVPALLIAMMMGIALFCQHPKEFSRMRWWRLKMLLLFVVIPTSHFFCRSRFTLLRDASDRIVSTSLAHQLMWGLAGALAGSVLIFILGRIKPRLGTPTLKRPTE